MRPNQGFTRTVLPDLPDPLKDDRSLGLALTLWGIRDSRPLAIEPRGHCATPAYRNDQQVIADDKDRRWARRWLLCDDSPHSGSAAPLVGFVHTREVDTDQSEPTHKAFDIFIQPPRGIERHVTVTHSDWLTITGQNSPVRHIKCAPLVLPDLDYEGTCSQAACQSVLLLALRFGGRPMGALDISRLAEGAVGSRINASIGPNGLSAPQMCRALHSQYSGINAFYDSFTTDHNGLAASAIASYVRSGFPVIVIVKTKTWLAGLEEAGSITQCQHNKVMDFVIPTDGGTHAVIAVGADEDRFFVNDSLLGVYIPVLHEGLVRAAAAVESLPKSQNTPTIRLVTAVPRAVDRGRDYSWLVRVVAKIAPKAKNEPYSPRAARLIKTCRLLDSRDGIHGWGMRLQDDCLADAQDVLQRIAGDYVWVCDMSKKGQTRVLLLDAARQPHPHIGQLLASSLQLYDERGGMDTWNLWRVNSDGH